MAINEDDRSGKQRGRRRVSRGVKSRLITAPTRPGEGLHRDAVAVPGGDAEARLAQQRFEFRPSPAMQMGRMVRPRRAAERAQQPRRPQRIGDGEDVDAGLHRAESFQHVQGVGNVLQDVRRDDHVELFRRKELAHLFARADPAGGVAGSDADALRLRIEPFHAKSAVGQSRQQLATAAADIKHPRHAGGHGHGERL